MIAVAGIYTIILIVAFQIAFSPPASTTIKGLQGRYFLLPLLIAYLGVVTTMPSWLQWRGGSVIASSSYVFLTIHITMVLLAAYSPQWS